MKHLEMKVYYYGWCITQVDDYYSKFSGAWKATKYPREDEDIIIFFRNTLTECKTIINDFY
jgi:hypothetical protein